MTVAHSVFRKGYADCSIGQIFYRKIVESAWNDRPIITLLHWTPLSSRMFRHLAPKLAERGIDVLMFDLPGYGRSDPRPTDWSMEAYGNVIGEALKALGIEKTHLLGGHNGASVALETALSAPELVDCVILDGCPILTDELKEAFRQMENTNAPTIKEDGAHKLLPFMAAEGLWREYVPDFSASDENLPMLYETMIDFLETDFVSSAPVAGYYDITERLPLLNAPTLVLSAEKDSLRGTFEQSVALAKPAASHLFSGNHPIYAAETTDRYAEKICSFLEDQSS